MEGRCLCGEIAYAAEGEPSVVTVCHCRFCQRATGAAYLVDALFKRERFRVTKGQAQVYDHVSAGSGQSVHIHFCARCGTKLWMTFQRFPALVGIYAGTLDDPGAFDRSPSRVNYIFTDSAAPWTVLPAGARTWPGDLTEADGTRRAPLCMAEACIMNA